MQLYYLEKRIVHGDVPKLNPGTHVNGMTARAHRLHTSSYHDARITHCNCLHDTKIYYQGDTYWYLFRHWYLLIKKEINTRKWCRFPFENAKRFKSAQA